MSKINHIMTLSIKQNNHGLLSQRKSFLWGQPGYFVKQIVSPYFNGKVKQKGK